MNPIRLITEWWIEWRSSQSQIKSSFILVVTPQLGEAGHARGQLDLINPSIFAAGQNTRNVQLYAAADWAGLLPQVTDRQNQGQWEFITTLPPTSVLKQQSLLLGWKIVFLSHKWDLFLWKANLRLNLFFCCPNWTAERIDWSAKIGFSWFVDFV